MFRTGVGRDVGRNERGPVRDEVFHEDPLRGAARAACNDRRLRPQGAGLLCRQRR